MSVLKRGIYDESQIQSLSFNVVEINEASKTDNLNGFDKEAYIEAFEESKALGYKEGYDEGYRKGYQEGYEVGRLALEQIKEETYNNLETDKQNFKALMERESISYVNKFRTDISNLLMNSINKIFFDAISSKAIMSTYFENLIDYISNNYKEFSVSANSKTLKIYNSVIEKHNLIVSVDNKIQDYDVIIHSSSENLEFFIKDEFEKVISLFEQ